MTMLTKITSKNQVTIPKAIMSQLPAATYFEVELREGVIVLKPVRTFQTDTEQIRAKMANLGLTENSVAEAVEWARKSRQKS